MEVTCFDLTDGRSESRVEQNYKQYKKEGRKWGEKEIKVLTKETMTKQMICTFNTFIEVTAAR